MEPETFIILRVLLIFPCIFKNTKGLNQIYVQTIFLHLQSSRFGAFFLNAPPASLKTAWKKSKKKRHPKTPAVSWPRRLSQIGVKVKLRNAHVKGFSPAPHNAHLDHLSITLVHSNHHIKEKTVTENKPST